MASCSTASLLCSTTHRSTLIAAARHCRTSRANSSALKISSPSSRKHVVDVHINSYHNRFFSSAPNTRDSTAAVAKEQRQQPQQPFVQTRIQEGEWDPARKNPLYRPKYKSRAKIISAEDFANRPRVGIESTDFASFADAMVTLSWLDDADQKRIYQQYLDLMTFAHEKYGTTSHEYVCRVIAQNFNITANRVAAIVQLQHNEAQYAKDPNRRLLTEAQEMMDKAIQQEINDAYQAMGEKKPDTFVEDPVGMLGRQESKTYVDIPDIFDMDQLMNTTIHREQDQARLLIDNHVYVEDIDDEAIPVPLNKDAKRLLKAKEELTKAIAASSSPSPSSPKQKKEEGSKPAETADTAETTSTTKPRRPRWKYVAQIVNVRELDKKQYKHQSYHNNRPRDTLVEEDNTLRPATMADIRGVAWKPVRNVQEHTFAGAKRAWLDKSVRKQMTAWGKGPPISVAATAAASVSTAASAAPAAAPANSPSPESDRKDDSAK